jgi:phage terminase large subunit-like protein
VLKSCRYFDKAGTESGEGAYTAGALIHMLKDNHFVIEHVVRGRRGALEREEKIKFWAERDRANWRPVHMKSVLNKSQAVAAKKVLKRRSVISAVSKCSLTE